jgi:hypothetical protein
MEGIRSFLGGFKSAKDAKDAKGAKGANPWELASLPVLRRLWHSRPRLCIWETSRNFAKLGRFLAKLSVFLRQTMGNCSD